MHVHTKRQSGTKPWHAVAVDLKNQGWRQRDIARHLGVNETGISHLLSRLRGEAAPARDGKITDSDFIKTHVTRVVRKVFDRDAIRAFIKAGGGEAARIAMLGKLGIQVAVAA